MIVFSVLVLILSLGYALFLKSSSKKPASGFANGSGKTTLDSKKTFPGATEKGTKGSAVASAPVDSKKTLGAYSGVRVPILTYHYIGENPNPNDKARYALSVTPTNFEAQMKYLSDNGYHTISLDTLAASLLSGSFLPLKPVILTFDDGYIDFYLNAYPILSKYGLSATEFVITGRVGTSGYLSWGQIDEMKRSGRIIFGSHSVNHVALASLAYDKLIFELTESKKELESRLGYPVNFLAYPYGSFNNTVIGATQKAGYVGAVSTVAGVYQSKGNLYYLSRIREGNSLSDFIARLNM